MTSSPRPGMMRKLLDPAYGTGGMLAEEQNNLREHHGDHTFENGVAQPGIASSDYLIADRLSELLSYDAAALARKLVRHSRTLSSREGSCPHSKWSIRCKQ